MRITAIWVEDYNVIVNQGFNLGSQLIYSFAFDPIKRSLAITARANAEYYPLFEPPVKNITGIIGINGSGKTSLLRLLNLIAAGKPLKTRTVIIAENETTGSIEVYNYLNNEYRFSALPTDLKISFPQNGVLDTPAFPVSLQQSNIFSKIDLVFYSNLVSEHNEKYLALDNPLNRSVNYQMQLAQSPENMREYLKEFDRKKEESMLMAEESFNPMSLYYDEKMKRMITFLDEMRDEKPHIVNNINFRKTIAVWFEEFIGRETEKLIKKTGDQYIEFYPLYKLGQELIKQEADTKEAFKKGMILHYFLIAFYNDFYRKSKTVDSLKDLSAFLQAYKKDHTLFDQLKSFMRAQDGRDDNASISRINNLLEELDQLLSTISITESEGVFFGKGIYELTIDRNLWNFLERTNQITDHRYKSVITYRNDPFSAGEDAILNQFSEFYEAFKSLRNDHIFVAIDEGELYLHPEWQRQYIQSLCDFFIYFGKKFDKSFQLIITSHSPFIASDLPRYNLLFLQKNSSGITDVSGSENHLPTLAGNIFELFSDGFFMKEFIGEFALKKIDQIIAFLTGHESTIKTLEQADQLISLIGEPVLREELIKLRNLRIARENGLIDLGNDN
ncbi:AAA family ATPase [Flavobacterium hauense]